MSWPRDWQLTRVRLDEGGFRSTWIEGYCSRQSVQAGETLDIMVSATPARKFHLEIFRLCYYGGRGARLMIDLTGAPGTLNITWISISMSRVVESSEKGGYRLMDKTIEGGGVVTLAAPYKSGWVAAIVKKGTGP